MCSDEHTSSPGSLGLSRGATVLNVTVAVRGEDPNAGRRRGGRQRQVQKQKASFIADFPGAKI